MKALILGSTGYTGLVILRLLAGHPEISQVIPVSSSQAGKSLAQADPGLRGVDESKFTLAKGRFVTAEEGFALGPDVIMSCLPPGKSSPLWAPHAEGRVVVDLAADCRMRDFGLFEAGYGFTPPEPEMARKAAYGLVEWKREEIKGADVIAAPGCYPTVSLLPLLPLAEKGLIRGHAFINASSGISGAGGNPKRNTLFAQRSENTGAYHPGRKHRHYFEIREKLSEAGGPESLLFTPHLVPLRRGMTATTVAHLSAWTGPEAIQEALKEAYGEAPFVRILDEGLPESKAVLGSNRIDMAFRIEEDEVILFSALDNLMKGASGQMVQAMNVRFGFDETAGLQVWGEF